MSTRERHSDDRDAPPTPSMPTPDATTREAAQRLAAHAEEAIARALSRDSTAFLSASRQISGQ